MASEAEKRESIRFGTDESDISFVPYEWEGEINPQLVSGFPNLSRSGFLHSVANSIGAVQPEHDPQKAFTTISNYLTIIGDRTMWQGSPDKPSDTLRVVRALANAKNPLTQSVEITKIVSAKQDNLRSGRYKFEHAKPRCLIIPFPRQLVFEKVPRRLSKVPIYGCVTGIELFFENGRASSQYTVGFAAGQNGLNLKLPEEEYNSFFNATEVQGNETVAYEVVPKFNEDPK